MGLDNGFVVKSNKRQITREMLPEGIVYPFDFEPTEVVYWRKNWGLRNEVMDHFGWKTTDLDHWKFNIESPKGVMELILIIASFLDPVKWEDEGDSIWDFDEIKDVLVQNIVNLALVKSFMEANPDTYLEFYDSF